MPQQCDITCTLYLWRYCNCCQYHTGDGDPGPWPSPLLTSMSILNCFNLAVVSFLLQEEDQLGDISTLADPTVVETLLSLRGK